MKPFPSYVFDIIVGVNSRQSLLKLLEMNSIDLCVTNNSVFDLSCLSCRQYVCASVFVFLYYDFDDTPLLILMLFLNEDGKFQRKFVLLKRYIY